MARTIGVGAPKTLMNSELDILAVSDDGISAAGAGASLALPGGPAQTASPPLRWYWEADVVVVGSIGCDEASALADR
jgi:hypothetical protein